MESIISQSQAQQELNQEIEKNIDQLKSIVTYIIIALFIIVVIFGALMIYLASIPKVLWFEKYISYTAFSFFFGFIAFYSFVNAYFAWKKKIFVSPVQLETIYRYHSGKSLVIYNPWKAKIAFIGYTIIGTLIVIFGIMLALYPYYAY